ncbi:hypothetical protein [Pseudarthrobacter sp. NPDC080039]|uniref:hypothetical protein n=1 Tax=unclassified Pseudarthrobacter TaxID=2647000 RepID=UPI00344B9C02
MSAVQSEVRRRWAAGCAVALLALAGCSTAPTGSPTTPPPSVSASPATTMPSVVYTDQQLADIATTVVQSRSIQGQVRDPASVRGNMALQGTTVTSTTIPAECSPFRLHEDTDTQLRYLDTSASITAGQMPVAAAPGSQTLVIAFTIRSAAGERLAKADFDYTDPLLSKCAQFERTYTDNRAGQSISGPPYTALLVTAPPVGEKSYATTQKAKCLGAQDMGTGGMQVLAGTIAIDLNTTLWPVNSDTTARAMDVMAGFARDLIAESLKNEGPQPIPPGARTPQELEGMLRNLTGPAGETFYLSPTDSRAVTRMAGVSSAPMPGSCTFDDASYYGALAGNATTAHGIGSGSDKAIMFDVAVISTGTSTEQPSPFDARAAALADCSTIRANVQGQGETAWSSVTPITAGIDADSGYAFKYSVGDGQFHWYIRLGARRGNLSIEVNTFAGRGLADGSVQSAIDTAAAIITQTFARAGA